MIKKTIIAAIIKRIQDSKGKNYEIWRIGITHSPKLRKEQHGDPKHWVQWKADSLADAQYIEDYFLNEFPTDSKKRMSGGTGGKVVDGKVTYIYIY